LGLFARGAVIRYQMMLMGGDAFIGVLILGFTASCLLSQPRIPLWMYLFTPAILVTSFLCEIYNPQKFSAKKKLIRSLWAGSGSFIFLIIIPDSSGGSLWQLIFCLILFLGFQNGWQRLFRQIRSSVVFQKNILVIGTGPMAKKIEHLISASPGRYNLVGYIGTASDPVSVAPEAIIGSMDKIVEMARHYNAHALVIALTERRGNLTIEKLVACKLMGVRIMEYPSFYEMITGKIPVEDINPSWLVQSSGFLITPMVRIMKRVLDIILASLLLGVMLPFFLPVVLIIKLTSPGPVFYFQERVGTHGKNFTIYKFRSMTADAEKTTGAAWARENDSRVTSFGLFMRKTRIDELPQLINVLNGDMSFIGPRPERPEFVEQIQEITPYYKERHAVKPGITGWAQVMFPYGASLGDAVEKLRYDLYYINNLSFTLELMIMLETVKVVLFRKGSR